MKRQTLQQQTPVYHVCQACGGEGCEACSDLCILEGEIDTYPDECVYCGAAGYHADGCHFVEPDIYQSTQVERFASVANLMARMPYRSVHSEWNRSYLEDCGL